MLHSLPSPPLTTPLQRLYTQRTARRISGKLGIVVYKEQKNLSGTTPLQLFCSSSQHAHTRYPIPTDTKDLTQIPLALQAELAAQLCLLAPAHYQGLIPYMARMMHAVTKVSHGHRMVSHGLSLLLSFHRVVLCAPWPAARCGAEEALSWPSYYGASNRTHRSSSQTGLSIGTRAGLPPHCAL